MDKTLSDKKTVESPNPDVESMANGNGIIPLNLLDFNGNQSINSIDTLLDQMFLAFTTVSIEGHERRFNSDERDELMAEINRLQEGGE